jgi:hypothetical protein
MDFSVGSYHSRSWWPFVKLMSSLWKMAAHWKGAAGLVLVFESKRWERVTYRAGSGTWCNGTICCLEAPDG